MVVQTQAAAARKGRRAPKAGFFFALLRVVGVVLEAGGIFTTLASCIGFAVLLVKTGPGLASSLHYSGQSFAGFVFIITLAWLAVPLVLGLLGIVAGVIGFVLFRAATLPAQDMPGGVNPAREPPAGPGS